MWWIRNLTLAATVALAVSGWPARAWSANYRVTFDAIWSSDTHPNAYPANAHFSTPIGTAHNEMLELWAPGGLATPGVELVAEVGSVRLLRQEIAEAIDAGTALGFAQGATFNSPGTNRFLVETSDAFPLVSLVSMIAPSPDWFVGVRGLDLRDDSGWIEQLTIPLLPYDAGTESGEGFRTSNPATDPAAPIASLDDDESSVFFQSGPLGTLRFQRLAACDLNGDGRCDVADLNSNSGLYSAGDLAQGVAVTLGVNSRFDLNGDAMIDGSDLDRWLDLAATHNGFAEPYLRGDTNLNDHVGFGDFLSLSRAFGTGVEWSEGNYDGSPRTDFGDFLTLSGNFGRQIPRAPSTASVPEPSAWSIVVLGLGCLLRLRRTVRLWA